MPKSTFFNLDEEKRSNIQAVLLEEFEKKPLDEVTVKVIVEKLNIPRGSFYQYFESLQEAYFYILKENLKSLHGVFIGMDFSDRDKLERDLDGFLDTILLEVYRSNKYDLYKTRYLYWNAQMEEKWKQYNSKSNARDEKLVYDEKIRYIMPLVYSLIQRIFTENLSEKEFENLYKKYIGWIIGGIEL